MRPVGKLDNNPEIAPAPSQAPEQILVRIGAGRYDFAVRGYNLECKHVVTGETVFPNQPAHTSAQRQSRDPGF